MGYLVPQALMVMKALFPKPKKRAKKKYEGLKRSYISRKTPLKKRGKSDRKKLVYALDAEVSRIVRERDKRCVIPNCKTPFYKLGAGHLFSRGHYSMRWDYHNNVFAQCWPCNYKHVRDPMPYYTWFQDTYGIDQFRMVYVLWKQVKKYSNKNLEELLEKLKQS